MREKANCAIRKPHTVAQTWQEKDCELKVWQEVLPTLKQDPKGNCLIKGTLSSLWPEPEKIKTSNTWTGSGPQRPVQWAGESRVFETQHIFESLSHREWVLVLFQKNVHDIQSAQKYVTSLLAFSKALYTTHVILGLRDSGNNLFLHLML